MSAAAPLRQLTTPWYPGSVRPERQGIYQRAFPSGSVQQAHWDGFEWRIRLRGEWCKSSLQELPWRGLTSEGYTHLANLKIALQRELQRALFTYLPTP